MAEQERLIKFHLLGQDFAFYTGASEEEMDSILSLVRQQVEDNTGGAGGTIPVSKIAVMACLNLASRYVRLKREHDDYKEVTEKQLLSINEKIEHYFTPEK